MTPSQPSREIPGNGGSGYPALALCIVAALLGILASFAGTGDAHLLLAVLFLSIFCLFLIAGFYKTSSH
jgi:hypothetical protein